MKAFSILLGGSFLIVGLFLTGGLVSMNSFEGAPKLFFPLDEEVVYHVSERWRSFGPPSSFVLKMSLDGASYSEGRFYQIAPEKMRDEYLKEIPLEEIPSTFTAKIFKGVLPENLPSLEEKQVFIITPVFDGNDKRG